MSLVSHTEHELRIAGYHEDGDQDDPNTWMAQHITALVKVFAEEGHSGMSAPYAVKMFARLAMYKPLTPLTGEDDEWTEHDDGTFQNKRFSEVFKKGKDGEAYWITGRVFWEWLTDEDGNKYKSHFTSRDSRVPVTFPFTVPDEPEYVERRDEELTP